MLTFPAPSPLNGEALRAEIETALGQAAGSVAVALVDVSVVVTGADANPTIVQQTVSAHSGAPDPRLTNVATLQQRALSAIAGNSNYLAVTAPSNQQALAQIAALTRQNTAILRLMLGQLDSTGGT